MKNLKVEQQPNKKEASHEPDIHAHTHLFWQATEENVNSTKQLNNTGLCTLHHAAHSCEIMWQQQQQQQQQTRTRSCRLKLCCVFFFAT